MFSIEFDPFSFSVKDLVTNAVLLRCSTVNALYPFFGNNGGNSTAALTVSAHDLWHRRLGHPSTFSFSHFPLDFLQQCYKDVPKNPLCAACQLGKHTPLPFPTSTSYSTAPLHLVHCDLWTSPIVSFSGYKYYLVILDDYTHFLWTFPLRAKSNTCDTLLRLFKFIHTQFGVVIPCLQSDNGGEFHTTPLRAFFSSNGISFCLTCPHTSAQNGKAERLIRTINDVVRTLLFQAKLPPHFSVLFEPSTYLFSVRPSFYWCYISYLG